MFIVQILYSIINLDNTINMLVILLTINYYCLSVDRDVVHIVVVSYIVDH
jgi:hypothetical protein